MKSARDERSCHKDEKLSIAIFGLSANPPTGNEVATLFSQESVSIASDRTIICITNKSLWPFFLISSIQGHVGIVKYLAGSGYFDESEQFSHEQSDFSPFLFVLSFFSYPCEHIIYLEPPRCSQASDHHTRTN